MIGDGFILFIMTGVLANDGFVEIFNRFYVFIIVIKA